MRFFVCIYSSSFFLLAVVLGWIFGFSPVVVSGNNINSWRIIFPTVGAINGSGRGVKCSLRSLRPNVTGEFSFVRIFFSFSDISCCLLFTVQYSAKLNKKQPTQHLSIVAIFLAATVVSFQIISFLYSWLVSPGPFSLFRLFFPSVCWFCCALEKSLDGRSVQQEEEENYNSCLRTLRFVVLPKNGESTLISRRGGEPDSGEKRNVWNSTRAGFFFLLLFSILGTNTPGKKRRYISG